MGILLISVLSNLIVKVITESSSVRVTATTQSDGSVVAIATRN